MQASQHADDAEPGEERRGVKTARRCSRLLALAGCDCATVGGSEMVHGRLPAFSETCETDVHLV
jgi:hypothetical protein